MDGEGKKEEGVGGRGGEKEEGMRGRRRKGWGEKGRRDGGRGRKGWGGEGERVGGGGGEGGRDGGGTRQYYHLIYFGLPVACLRLSSCTAVRYVHSKEVFRKLCKECPLSS